MIVAPSPLLVVVRARPSREPNGLIGEFVKRLLHEFRASQPMMHPERLPAPFSHRPNAGIRLDLDRRFPPGPVSPEGGGQARGTHVPRARETGEELVIGMLGKHLGNAILEGRDGADQPPHLRRVGLDREAERLDDR